MDLLDCRNLNLEDQDFLEIIAMYGSRDLVVDARFNNIECIEISAFKEVYLEYNPVNCECQFPPEVYTSCPIQHRPVGRTTLGSTTAPGTLRTSSELAKSTTLSTTRRQTESKIHTTKSTTRQDQSTVYSTGRVTAMISIATSARSEQNATRVSQAKAFDTMPPHLPSYQPPLCENIWTSPYLYGAFGTGIVLGALFLLCIGYINMKLRGW